MKKLVLDIETVPISNAELTAEECKKASLDALTGKIVCLGFIVVDEFKAQSAISIVSDDEKKLLTTFWSTLQKENRTTVEALEREDWQQASLHVVYSVPIEPSESVDKAAGLDNFDIVEAAQLALELEKRREGELSFFDESEIVVGLVCAVGVNYQQCIHVLDAEFRKMGYSTRTVSISSLMDNLARSCGLAPIETPLPELARIRARMALGNSLRCKTERPGIMALAAVQNVNMYRRTLDKDGAQPAFRTVHILATLKRPEEVEALRQIYGAGFFLLGLHHTENGRLNFLVDQQGIESPDAQKLMEDDHDDHQPFGQLTRDTYYLSDVFVSLEERKYKQQVKRFVELLFSHPYHTPTRDEYSMFMAHAASLRSSQLGRQVCQPAESRKACRHYRHL